VLSAIFPYGTVKPLSTNTSGDASSTDAANRGVGNIDTRKDPNNIREHSTPGRNNNREHTQARKRPDPEHPLKK